MSGTHSMTSPTTTPSSGTNATTTRGGMSPRVSASTGGHGTPAGTMATTADGMAAGTHPITTPTLTSTVRVIRILTCILTAALIVILSVAAAITPAVRPGRTTTVAAPVAVVMAPALRAVIVAVLACLRTVATSAVELTPAPWQQLTAWLRPAASVAVTATCRVAQAAPRAIATVHRPRRVVPVVIKSRQTTAPRTA